MSNTAPYAFDRFGRAHHLKIASPSDLHLALDLDEAHWVASSAPVETLQLEPTLLNLLDIDQDGIIQIEDVKREIRWLLDTLTDTTPIAQADPQTRLASLNPRGPSIERLRTGFGKLQGRLKLTPADPITLTQVRTIKAEEEALGLSEAGVVPMAAAEVVSPSAGRLASEILATVGGAPHPSGEEGFTEEGLTEFQRQCAAFVAWYDLADPDRNKDAAFIRALPGQTRAAADCMARVKTRLEQHFTLCDAVRLYPRLSETLWPTEAELAAMDFSNPEQVEALLRQGPLTQPSPNPVLDFEAPFNPRDADTFAELRGHLSALLDQDTPIQTLTRDQWTRCWDRLEPWRQWQDKRPEVQLGDLPVERMRALLDGGDDAPFNALREMLDESHQRAVVMEELRAMERLMLLQRHALRLVNSFVSFPDLYDPNARALFEMGTLVIDGRRFTLAVRVPDRSRHIQFSDASNMFVMYVEVLKHHGEALYEVAVPVTSGERGNLQVGKHGVFYDLEGDERRATVVHIVENPISLREAIQAPFKRLGAALSGRLEKFTSNAEADFLKQAQAPVSTPPLPDAPPPEAAAPPATPVTPPQATQRTLGVGDAANLQGGLIAGGGIALAALGSAGAFITQTLANIPVRTLVFTFLALALALILPLVTISWLKLRRRDLSAILEGSHWGINTRMRLTWRQSLTFTLRPKYPEGSSGVVSEWRWLLWLILAVVVVGALGWYFQPPAQSDERPKAPNAAPADATPPPTTP